MALTNPPAAPVAPGTAPSRSDRATFAARADAAWTWLFSTFFTWVGNFNAWYGTANTELTALQADMAAKQEAAAGSAAAASGSAAAASVTASATAWNAATAYLLNQCAISQLNFQTYRRIVAGTTATDPKNDLVNWVQISISPTDTLLTNPTITNYTEVVYSPAAGTAFTVDLANGSNQVFTTSGNCTITLPVPVAGKCYGIDVIFGGAHTVTWAVAGGTLCWPSATAPTVTSVAGKRDSFGFKSTNATNTHGSTVGLNYAA